MDVGELLALLRRRWAIVVPLLALTVVGIGGAWAKVPTQYQSQVQLTMLNAPKITDEPGNDGNPYLAFDTTLAVDVDFLSRNISSGASASQLATLGVTESYSAAIADNALGPFMQLTVTGPDKQHISKSMQVLIKFTEQRWQSLQVSAGSPAGSIIGMSEIAPPSSPTKVLKRKFEAVAGIALVGIVLSVLIAVVLDSILRRRSGRHGGSQRRPLEAAKPEPVPQRSPVR